MSRRLPLLLALALACLVPAGGGARALQPVAGSAVVVGRLLEAPSLPAPRCEVAARAQPTRALPRLARAPRSAARSAPARRAPARHLFVLHRALLR